jgi:signal transduction histidine kinase
VLDAQLVRHILVNLLSNALKYSPADRPVHCRAHVEGERLHLQVQDEGIGIPDADMSSLFQSFHRGANVGNVPGTGIGLHVVKQCVDLHRGTIAVDTAPGQGTLFRVDLHAPGAH